MTAGKPMQTSQGSQGIPIWVQLRLFPTLNFSDRMHLLGRSWNERFLRETAIW